MKIYYGACVLRGEKSLQTHTQNINTYCFVTATTVTWKHPNVKLYVHCVSSYSHNRDLNQDSITSCSRLKLIQFTPHNCTFERTGLKTLERLKENIQIYTNNIVQGVKFKNFHSPNCVTIFLFLQFYILLQISNNFGNILDWP